MATTAEDNNIQISPPYFPEHNSLEESYNNKRDLQHLRLYKKNELAGEKQTGFFSVHILSQKVCI